MNGKNILMQNKLNEISEEQMYKNLGITWKNPPKLADLKKDLKEAEISYIKQKNKIEHWLDLLNGGKVDTVKGRSNIKPKLIRKQIEWRCPALEEPFLSTDDMFTLNPVTHKDVESAKQNELILNKQFRVDIPRVKFISKFIRTAVTTGTVICKVGWEKEEAIVRQQVQEEVLLTNSTEIEEYIQTQILNGLLDEQSAIALLQSGKPIPIVKETIKNVKKLIKDGPTIEVKDARNCYIDPACDGDNNKIKYIIDKFSSNISDLTQDGRYKNLKYIHIDTNSTSSDNDLSENNDDETANYPDKARKKLDVYEYWGYWDINDNYNLELIRIFWTQDVIIRAERNPYPDKKMPYVIIPYLDNIPNSLYGESEASLLEDNQQIIGGLTRGILDLMARSANGQRAYKKETIDAVNLAKMQAGKDFAFNAHVNNPQEVFYMFSYPEIPNSVFNLINWQNNEAEAMTGVKAFNQGITGQSLGDSVGGIKTALDATSKREASILRRLVDGLIEIGRKIIAMNSQFLPDETILKITDNEDVIIKRDDLAGNFDINIEISTSESDNQKANDLSFVLQTIGPQEDPEIRKIVLSEIAELRKLPHLAEKIRNYQPQPDPLDQEIKMLQIEMLKAQIANEHAKAQENAVDVQLKGWKAKLTEAQVRATHSNADKLDLDYLEQAEGLTHDRKLEEIVYKNKTKDEKSNNNNNT